MSLILEALRKSEAERRRGQAPDVATELPPMAATGARRTASWMLPMALAGIALAGLAFWRLQPPAAPHPASVPIEPAPSRAEMPAPAVVARPLPPAATALPPPVPAAMGTATPPVQAPAAPAADPPPPAARTATPPPTVDRPAEVGTAPALPSMRLSMHMWDESPARRFVILNGQRMVEGDRIGDVTLVAIARDGVVLERGGQRNHVPLP